MTTASRPPQAGEPAPDFTLPDTAKRQVTLSGFRGESAVLLAFFPAAFSSVCTEEFCGLTDQFPQVDSETVTVFGISVDSRYALREFREKYDMPFEMLSDFHRDVSRAYGVLLEPAMVANRAYFLIDREGVVRWAHVEEHPGFRRQDDELLAQIAALA